MNHYSKFFFLVHRIFVIITATAYKSMKQWSWYRWSLWYCHFACSVVSDWSMMNLYTKPNKHIKRVFHYTALIINLDAVILLLLYCWCAVSCLTLC